MRERLQDFEARGRRADEASSSLPARHRRQHRASDDNNNLSGYGVYYKDAAIVLTVV